MADACVKLPVMDGLPSRINAFIDGAESTLPSSTNANWLRGDCRGCRRWLIWPNVVVPSESKTMLTAHSFFCESRPDVASEIELPSISTGPRMNLAVPVSSHVISG